MLGSNTVTDLVGKGHDGHTEAGLPGEGDEAGVWTEIASNALTVFQCGVGVVPTYPASIGHP